MAEAEIEQLRFKTEDKLIELKRQKATAKAGFTRARNKLYNMIEGEHIPLRREIRDQIDLLSVAQEKAMDIMVTLSEEYLRNGDVDKVKTIGLEMTKLEEDNDSAMEHAQLYLDSQSDASSVSSMHRKMAFPANKGSESIHTRSFVGQPENALPSQNSPTSPKDRQTTFHKTNVGKFEPDYHRTVSSPIGKDMWAQLKRVSIPVFSGDVKSYQGWKAAFTACIDNSPATPEYKLLHLRQYLSGEALRVISNLGHNAIAYQVALERLERRFG